MYQVTVGSVMTPDPVTVRPGTDFTTILEMLLSHDIGAVPVVSDRGALLGMVTEADLLPRREDLADGSGRPLPFARQRARQRWDATWATTALDLMTTPVPSLDAAATLAAAAREFGRSRARRLFVLADGALAGVLTRGDLLMAFVRADDDIVADVRQQALTRVPGVDAATVGVIASGGVVTLTGTVERRGDAELAATLASHVLGVVHVVNQLTYRLDQERGLARR
ncbi:CBS domain-containing protein [Prauserella muralis]|uniref:Uncharacterized protein n=1 Tax=Prauserella muralis TaxID=588067 RepID=A0A2V4AHN9_9PSEU|nr:CBS domain-containing protein [Prauserella muralis]PXY19418.1 hypothetical protein BAY60_32260 [Prauserella muralis]TWE29391.1 CBS domain protein [Prauserella muralis]